jgi:hypothetical protein
MFQLRSGSPYGTDETGGVTVEASKWDLQDGAGSANLQNKNTLVVTWDGLVNWNLLGVPESPREEVFKQESGLNGTVRTGSKRVQGESREKERAGGKLRQKVTGSAIWRGIFHSARARPNNNNGLTEDDGRQFPTTKPSIHPSIHEATPRGTRDSRELCLPTSNERIGGPGKKRGRVPTRQCTVIIAHSARR